MFFPRRQFLKTMAWLFGASQVPTPTSADAAGPARVATPPGPAAPVTSASTQPASSPSSSQPGSDAALRGGSGATEPLHHAAFELVVVGGGLSGTAAAISAARNGVTVALVHERSMLGGNSASEVRLYPENNDGYQPWIRESGLHEEFHLEDRARNHLRYREGLTNCHWDLVLYEWCVREPNLTLFLNAHVHQVRMAEGGGGNAGAKRIAAVRAIQLGTEKTFELTAPLFVDATGDGVLGYRAGADFRWGREARGEYGESLAPEQADEKVMGNTLFFRAVDTGKPVPFVRPGWAMEFPTEKDLFARNHQDLEAGYWWIEIGAPHHPIADNEQCRHEALRALLGVWDHIKNKSDHKAANYALEFVGFWPYKRESRRIIGDAVVTEQQVKDPKQLDDAVAYGAWGIDLHCQGGILAPAERPFVPPHNANFETLGTLPYGIGLRSLYSRNVDNLFTVGRNMSASYVAFCSTRVLSTGLICGQAAGVAAGLAKKYGKTPRQVAADHAKECQQLLLRQDAHIPGVENEDPKDLARSATASASSEATLAWPEPTTGRELTVPRAQLFPVSGDRIDTVSLWLASRRAEPFEMLLGLRAAPQVWDFRSNEDIATAKATIPAGHKGWIEFTFNKQVEPGKLYWVHAPAAPQILWRTIDVPRGVSHATPPGCSAAQRMGPTRWEQQGTTYCYGLKLSPPSKPYGAANINRGTHRPDRWTNLWISDPAAALPQHVELAWPAAQAFNTVLLTFDTNTGRRENLPLFRYPDCVKDYDLEARVGASWRTIASGRENYMRRCTHRFDRVEANALRLKVLATNGAPSARVYEIRVYDEA